MAAAPRAQEPVGAVDPLNRYGEGESHEDCSGSKHGLQVDDRPTVGAEHRRSGGADGTADVWIGGGGMDPGVHHRGDREDHPGGRHRPARVDSSEDHGGHMEYCRGLSPAHARRAGSAYPGDHSRLDNRRDCPLGSRQALAQQASDLVSAGRAGGGEGEGLEQRPVDLHRGVLAARAHRDYTVLRHLEVDGGGEHSGETAGPDLGVPA